MARPSENASGQRSGWKCICALSLICTSHNTSFHVFISGAPLTGLSRTDQCKIRPLQCPLTCLLLWWHISLAHSVTATARFEHFFSTTCITTGIDSFCSQPKQMEEWKRARCPLEAPSPARSISPHSVSPSEVADLTKLERQPSRGWLLPIRTPGKGKRWRVSRSRLHLLS